MSRNTLSSRADRARALPCAFAAAFAATASAGHLNVAAPALPAAVAAIAPGLRPQGGDAMTYFGLSIYDGWYWAGAHAWAPNGLHALDLHYHRSLEGAAIAERSVSEIEGIGAGSAAQPQRWGEAMRRIFPDVRMGDRITGVNLPGAPDDRLQRGDVAQVAMHEPRDARARCANSLAQGVGRGFVDVDVSDLGMLRTEMLDYARADAGAPAGHEHDLFGEARILCKSFADDRLILVSSWPIL